MRFNPEIHYRKSIRLKGYDYSRNGAYFVTICAWNRECIFGEIIDGKMNLSNIGLIINDIWPWLGEQYHFLHLLDYVIMPNHLHGLIVLDYCKGGSRTAPTEKSKPLGRLLGAFKTRSTKFINMSRQTSGAPVWQRNYYERIVRNEIEFNRIFEYIINNPANWNDDENNPINV